MSELRAHVVWADDQPQLLAEVRARLEARGFSISVVENGIDAAALVETTFPRILIVDIRMPPGDDGGLWLVQHVRALLQSTVTTIVLSGQGTRREVAQALRLGADHFVEKEASAETIEADILRFLEESKDERHEQAVGETRDELDRFEKETRGVVVALFDSEFGANASSRLRDELSRVVPEDKWPHVESKTIDGAQLLEQSYLSSLGSLLLGKWHRLSSHFSKVSLQRGEFLQNFERIVSIRNRLSHANHVPLIELLRTRVIVYDISRALSSWKQSQKPASGQRGPSGVRHG